MKQLHVQVSKQVQTEVIKCKYFIIRKVMYRQLTNGLL